MSRLYATLRVQLGSLGIVALVLLGASVVFLMVAVTPLETRGAKLDRDLGSAARRAPPGFARVSVEGPAAQLDSFYRFFQRKEPRDTWLAKLYGIALASNVDLAAGSYQLAETRGRLERYQITLPVAGSYTQIRAFAETALSEIPVLSLDQLTFRRKAASQSRIEAEIVFTLYSLRK